MGQIWPKVTIIRPILLLITQVRCHIPFEMVHIFIGASLFKPLIFECDNLGQYKNCHKLRFACVKLSPTFLALQKYQLNSLLYSFWMIPFLRERSHVQLCDGSVMSVVYSKFTKGYQHVTLVDRMLSHSPQRLRMMVIVQFRVHSIGEYPRKKFIQMKNKLIWWQFVKSMISPFLWKIIIAALFHWEGVTPLI